VWHAPDTTAPAKLMAALAERGIEAARVQSPYRALAELCRAGVGGRAAAPAIVLVHPEILSDAVALLEAKSRYAPGARCWMYGPALNPVLRAILESDITAWGGGVREPEVVVRPRAGDDSLRIESHREAPRPRPSPPRLKLAGDPAALPAMDPTECEAEVESKAPLLTPEELRMLLGDDEPGSVGER
jgi:hypothetical protein